MQLFKETNFDFMRHSRYALVLSVILLLVSIASLVVYRLNLGIDFTGGTLIELAFAQKADLDSIRAALAAAGLTDAMVQKFGTDEVLIRIVPKAGLSGAGLGDKVLQTLSDAQMRRVEFVGPQVGEELRDRGGLAVSFALIGILIYVTFRFEARFAFGAVIALVHDVLLVLGVFSLFRLNFDLAVLAAMLAAIGYSLNDTIVIFDRIRENFRALRKTRDAAAIINLSINQTLSRTLMTSVTTLLTLLALFFFGGDVIHSFTLALIVGVVVGTYSSWYVATASALALGASREILLKPEGVDADRRP